MNHVGDRIREAFWAIGGQLEAIEWELTTHWEAVVEKSRLLHHVLVYNLRQIEMTFEGRRGQEEEGESEVEGSGAVEESEERAKGVE